MSDKLHIIGTYTLDTGEIVAYEVADAFGDIHIYGTEQIAFFIGRGDIANCSIYMNGLKAYVRLNQGSIRDLPTTRFCTDAGRETLTIPIISQLKERFKTIHKLYDTLDNEYSSNKVSGDTIAKCLKSIGKIYTAKEFKEIISSILEGHGIPQGYPWTSKVYQRLNTSYDMHVAEQVLMACREMALEISDGNGGVQSFKFSHPSQKLVALSLMMGYISDCIQKENRQ